MSTASPFRNECSNWKGDDSYLIFFYTFICFQLRKNSTKTLSMANFALPSTWRAVSIDFMAAIIQVRLRQDIRQTIIRILNVVACGFQIGHAVASGIVPINSFSCW